MRVFEKKVIEECCLSLDGIEFSSKEECEEHDKFVLSKIRCFRVEALSDRQGGLVRSSFFAVLDGNGVDLEYIHEYLFLTSCGIATPVGVMYKDPKRLFNTTQISLNIYKYHLENKSELEGLGIMSQFVFISNDKVSGFPDPVPFRYIEI